MDSYFALPSVFNAARSLFRSSSGAGVAANDGVPAGLGDDPESGAFKADGVGRPDREHIVNGGSADACSRNSYRGWTKVERKLALIILLLSFCWLPVSSAGGQQKFDEEKAFERWQRMSPQQRQELRNRHERWKTLSPEEREKLQEKLDTWRRLPPEERGAIRKNYERWQQLPPERQQRLRQRWDRWQSFSPEKKQTLRRRYERYRQLSPEKRRELREQRKKRRGYSRERKRESRRHRKQKKRDRQRPREYR